MGLEYRYLQQNEVAVLSFIPVDGLCWPEREGFWSGLKGAAYLLGAGGSREKSRVHAEQVAFWSMAKEMIFGWRKRTQTSAAAAVHLGLWEPLSAGL